MSESTFQRSFAAGELAPAYHARGDSARYLEGLRRCRNFWVMRAGGVQNRPGFRFIGECKTTSPEVRLVRYVAADGQGYLIEAGQSYLRFYKNGAQITLSNVTAWSGATAYVIGDIARQGGVNYYCIKDHTNQVPPNATYWYAMPGSILEVPTTYTTTGLFGAWEQSGNVIAITHKLHDPRELVFLGDTHWILRLADTKPTTAKPTGLNVTPGPAGTRTYAYKITAAAVDTYEESPVTDAVEISGVGEPTEDNPHVLSWDTPAVPVAEWYVYLDPNGNGTFGFIGTATGAAEFNDTGVLPDFDVTPPLDRTPFVSADTRPHVVAHYQQRRFYAQSTNSPDGIEASRVGFVNNFGISSPLQDDDALSFRMIGRNYHPVRYMLGLKRLIVFTDGGAWAVGEPQKALTPSALFADQETYTGMAPDVVPVVIGESVIYLQARGRLIRDLRFDQKVEGLAGLDLTRFASHLFDKYTITRLDYAETPHSIVWAIRSDGVLLGMTYIRDEDAWGWHRHDTDGSFEQLCVVPEANRDALYVIVKRTIGGVDKRYIERLESREIVTFDVDSFFVDSGLSYSGAAATNFSGLGHLEGKTVVACGDGARVGTTFVVTGGAVTLPAAKTNVHIGLPITAQLETLDLDVAGANIRDKQKLVKAATVLIDESAIGFMVGPASDKLVPSRLHPWETAAKSNTAPIDVPIDATWDKPGRVFIEHTDPLPLTVLGVMPNLDVGG